MKYSVKIADNVMKKIEKLPIDRRKKILERLEVLKNNPDIGKLLFRKSYFQLRELKISSHRIYFIIERGFIVINNIEYYGVVDVERFGNKNSQDRDINFLKDKIRKR